MGASVTLVTPALAVEPGQEASGEVRVRNTGSVVDEFALDVLGDAAGWAVAEPPVLSLFPGAEGTAKLVFRPPRAASTPAGTVPYGLRARSREDPAGSAVEEGSIEVGTFLDPFAELAPRTSRGSGAGTHDLAIDNRGNVRLNAEVEGADADRQLKFDIKPPGVVVEPGMAGFAKIRVSPVKRFWRGQPKTRPFQLSVKPEGGTPITLDGTLLQESVLPPWFLKALLALVVLLIALVLIWLLLLKPTIQSAASDAVASPLASLKADVNDALAAGGLPTMGPEDGGTGAGESDAPSEAPPSAEAPSGDGAPTDAPTSTPGVVIPGLGNPVDGRLDRTRPQVDEDGTLFVTDFVFSNPNGAEGALVVLRNDTPLLQLRLENFRDYDLHFVTPLVIGPDDALNLSLSCTSPGSCDPAVFYSDLRPWSVRARRVAAVTLGLAFLAAGGPTVPARPSPPSRLSPRPRCRRRPERPRWSRNARAAPARPTRPRRSCRSPRTGGSSRSRPRRPTSAGEAAGATRPGRPCSCATWTGAPRSASRCRAGSPVAAAPATRRSRPMGRSSRSPTRRRPGSRSSPPPVRSSWRGTGAPAGPRSCRRTRAAGPRRPAWSPRSRAMGATWRSHRAAPRSSTATATTRTCSGTTAGRTILVSVGFDGEPTAATSGAPAINGNGNVVAFVSDGGDAIVNADTGSDTQVYVRTIRAGRTAEASVAQGGGRPDGAAGAPSLSADGNLVAFESSSSDVAPNDGNGAPDVFRRDMAAGETVLVSVTVEGRAARGQSRLPSISADGRMVAFQSTAQDLLGPAAAAPSAHLAATAPTPLTEIYERDLGLGDTVLVSVKRRGGPGGAPSVGASVGGNGRFVAFASLAVSLVAKDANDVADAFRRDMPPVPRLNPGTLAFGSRAVGSPPAAPSAATLVNAGWGPLTVRPASVAGPARPDYDVVADGCAGRVLHRQDACTVTVRFSPTRAGSRQATLRVPYALAGSPRTAALRGSGSQARLEVSPDVGPPGTVTMATGSGFPRNTELRLTWSRGLTPTMPVVRTDAQGRFRTQVLVFHNDRIGPRDLQASPLDPGDFPPISATMLVTRPSVGPPGFLLIRRVIDLPLVLLIRG